MMKKKIKMKTRLNDPDFYNAVEAAYKLGVMDGEKGERYEQKNHNSGSARPDRD